MKYRRAAAALLCATLALGLGACSGGSKDKSAQASKMYTWVSNESDRAQWDTFVKGVQETDPNFKLDIEGPSFQDYWTKIKTRMSSADAPCIVTTQAARAQELGELLTPLDDLAKEAGLDLTKYNQAMMQGMTVDGKVRAIPYDAEPMVLFYNKTMFAQAGLKEPGTDYTYEQFLSDAGARPGPRGAPPPPPPNPADTTDVPMQGFQAKKVAMVIEGPWFYSTIREGMENEVGVAVIPSKSGKPVGMIQGSGFGISAKCADKKAAFQNIMKMTTPEVVAYVGKNRGTVPSIDSALSGWAEGKPAQDAEVMKTLLADGQPLVTTSTWNQVVTQFTQYSPEGARGTRTAEDILGTIEKSVN